MLLARMFFGVVFILSAEQVHGHGGHQGAGKQIRGQHGEDDGLGQGHEEKSARRR